MILQGNKNARTSHSGLSKNANGAKQSGLNKNSMPPKAVRQAPKHANTEFLGRNGPDNYEDFGDNLQAPSFSNHHSESGHGNYNNTSTNNISKN